MSEYEPSGKAAEDIKHLYKEILFNGGAIMSYLNENELKQYLLSLPKKCCFKCKFWIADELPTFSENGKKHIPNDVTAFGDCRKHAPSLLQAESTNEYDAFIFPPTPGREWCGDFKKTIKFICR